MITIVPTSEYLRAAQLMRPKDTHPKVYVYVEDDIDKVFWRVFLEAANSECAFSVRVYQVSEKEVRGKDMMMKGVIEGKLLLGNQVLLCLDSDLDLLVDNYHVYTDELRRNPYIITTQWYAIENLKCYYPQLLEYIYKVTLADELTINTVDHLTKVSELLYNLFLVCVVSCELQDHYYSLNDLGKDMKLIHFEASGDICDASIKQIQAITRSHSHYRESNKEAFDIISKRITDNGYTSKDTLFLLRGHDLEETIVIPYVAAIAGDIRDNKLRTIGGAKCGSEYKKQLEQQYSNQTGVIRGRCGLRQRIGDLIRDCVDFAATPVYSRICNSVKTALVYREISLIMCGLLASRRAPSR